MSARRFRFPTAVLNERIATFVDAFYEELARLFHAQGWPWEEPRRGEGCWDHPDVSIRVAGRHKDGAIKILELAARRLPGVASVDSLGQVTLRHEHRWRVDIPRAYPASLGSIGIRALTPCYHPRLDRSGKGLACVHVNGEIDRVLMSILHNILLDPAAVQPPHLYPGADRGTNAEAMTWFATRPHAIHKRLLDLWAEAHGAEAFSQPEKSAPTIEVEET